MTDIRKRLNSSMTYDEYVSTFDKAPHKPCLKPLQDPQIELEELDLQEETQQQQQIVQKEKSLTVIYEEDEENRTPNKIIRLPQTQQPHRPRAQSENIQYTFISFMEKGIERKQSKKFE